MQRKQGFDATRLHFYEGPTDDLNDLQVWCYTSAHSYTAGETVNFHLSTTAKEIELEIFREGQHLVSVHKAAPIAGEHHTTPDDYYREGCGWPVGYQWKIPGNQTSGFYLVLCKVRNESGELQEHEAGFFIRPEQGKPTAKILLIATTCTWTAYNDWGGTSHYVGHSDTYLAGKSPQLSIHRPWAKGLLSIPGGAPRKPHRYKVRPGDIPRYPPIEFAYTRGYSKFYANAGWATYERLFVQWAGQNGYALDYATQTDLHCRPELLEQYPCVVMVGHDEYWTHKMRKAIDHYVESGGNFARFGGNFFWQIRLEDNGQTQICYKEDAAEHDPVVGTDNKHLLTSAWDDPLVGWNGAQTVGLNGICGVFSGVGHIAPRQGGGFTVYRPEHWAFAGADLCFGDQFGGEAKIFGYEVDGLDYQMDNGLPEPTEKDGPTIPDTQILAIGLGGNWEVDHGNKGTLRYYSGSNMDVSGMAQVRYGEVTEQTLAAAGRGNGMIVSCNKGSGQIFNAGTCEWVAGLQLKDTETDIITRNVLDHFVQTESLL